MHSQIKKTRRDSSRVSKHSYKNQANIPDAKRNDEQVESDKRKMTFWLHYWSVFKGNLEEILRHMSWIMPCSIKTNLIFREMFLLKTDIVIFIGLRFSITYINSWLSNSFSANCFYFW